MKIQELITELRRNPEVNVRNEGHPAAVKFLTSLGKDMDDYAVSMTSIPKLGVNPHSEYDTPLGVYFYTADYYVKIKSIPGNELEFMDDAPYIQIFKINGNIEVLSSMTQNHYNYYVKKLEKNTQALARILGRPEPEIPQLIHDIDISADDHARVQTPGGHLWYLTYALANAARITGRSQKLAKSPIAKRNAVAWNSIFRLLGIDGAIDVGDEIIHPNEPFQGAIFNPSVIQHVKTFTNPSEDSKKPYITLMYRTPISPTYLEFVIDTIENHKITFDQRHRSKFNRIMQKVLTSLKIFGGMRNLNPHTLKLLQSLTTNLAFRQQLHALNEIMGLTGLVFETHKIIKSLEEYQNHPAWPNWNLEQKQKIFNAAVSQDVIKRVQSMINSLRILKDDPFLEDRNLDKSLLTLQNALKVLTGQQPVSSVLGVRVNPVSKQLTVQ